MALLLFLQLSILSNPSDPAHAIYISVLEVDNQQMKVKVFTDNLEDAIRNDAYNYIPSTEEDFHVVNQHAIEWYFQKKIRLQINSREVGFSINETMLEGDSYWITFILEEHQEWKTFELEAKYLMELFPDQTNVVKVLGKRPQFFRLNRFFPSCSFEL